MPRCETAPPPDFQVDGTSVRCFLYDTPEVLSD
jgi:hypothetical protein